VYDELRAAIVEHRLAPGARLPSTRSLAADLGVARNTVALAYEQLRIEGYITGRRGGGTRVRDAVPDRALQVRPSAPRRRATSAPVATTAAAAREHAPAAYHTARAVLSSRGAALAMAGRALIQGTDPTPPRPFRLGVPALDAFPAQLWARLAARRWKRGEVVLGVGDPAGELPLRAAIASYVSTARGARCTAEQVIVVNGAQEALDLCARLLLDPGDAVWMEEPGYADARAAFAATGARVVPVPVDEDGLDVAAGMRTTPHARVAYVTPSHQFPLGGVMSAPRRLALLAWARSANAWIVEDDYDSEFRYSGRPLPCLQGLDAQSRGAHEPARVLYVGTFNKTLVPGLRLGYLVLPEALVDDWRAARAVTDRHPPSLEQGVVADFLGEGHYARHVRRLRALYMERQHLLLQAARGSLDGLLRLAPDPAGLHLVGWLARGLDETAAAAAARARGVDVYPLSRFRSAGATAAGGGLVLGYAAFEERALRAGVRRLAGALREVRGGGR
jgi:GntR family transcriptional regulator/MocR family aminotransferase